MCFTIQTIHKCVNIPRQVLPGVVDGGTNLSELVHQLSIFSSQRRSSRSLLLALRRSSSSSSSITWRTKRRQQESHTIGLTVQVRFDALLKGRRDCFLIFMYCEPSSQHLVSLAIPEQVDQGTSHLSSSLLSDPDETGSSLVSDWLSDRRPHHLSWGKKATDWLEEKTRSVKISQ